MFTWLDLGLVFWKRGFFFFQELKCFFFPSGCIDSFFKFEMCSTLSTLFSTVTSSGICGFESVGFLLDLCLVWRAFHGSYSPVDSAGAVGNTGFDLWSRLLLGMHLPHHAETIWWQKEKVINVVQKDLSWWADGENQSVPCVSSLSVMSMIRQTSLMSKDLSILSVPSCYRHSFHALMASLFALFLACSCCITLGCWICAWGVV